MNLTMKKNSSDKNHPVLQQPVKPTDDDFDDNLFDSLTPEGRLEVYSMLLIWCGYTFQKKILERRVEVESDPACKLSISVMLRSPQ
jgi:hypothetical protein